ncbi:MAG: DEAD/DEAH box helicase, partial [Polyangiaceae bacterium]
GRGLRAHAGKTSVTLIDFVGNHRMFLDRIRALLSLGGVTSTGALRSFLDSSAVPDLPEGCSVELELEAKELLSRLFKVSGVDEVERAYRELRLERGRRPTAGELQRMSYQPGRLRERHGSWFDFVRGEGDLDALDARAAQMAQGFLREVETTDMTRSFQMVALEALLEGDALTAGMPVDELATRSHALLRRSPELFADVAEDERSDTLEGPAAARWLAYWTRNPLDAWTRARRDRRTWFRIEGGRFLLDLTLDEDLAAPLAALTREIVDYRLAQYRARKRQGDVSLEGFACKLRTTAAGSGMFD